MSVRFNLPLFAAVTNAVVANWVVLVPAVAVGARGSPVNVGDAIGAAPKFVSAPFAVVAPVPPLPTGNVPVTPVVSGKPVALARTAAIGVPRSGVVKTGLVNVLLVNVSVPSNVANVPDTGKVTAVFAVVVNAVVKAPEVVKLPPNVIVFPVLLTPVPPFAPTSIPPKLIAPLAAEAGVKPVVLPLKVVTPVTLGIFKVFDTKVAAPDPVVVKVIGA